jgi:hypothetical protein
MLAARSTIVRQAIVLTIEARPEAELPALGGHLAHHTSQMTILTAPGPFPVVVTLM